MRSWPTIATGRRIRPSWFTGLQEAIDEIDTRNANAGAGICNVLDYEAEGDGVTVDTAAFQAAIDSGAHIIDVPSDREYLVPGLIVPSYRWFRGGFSSGSTSQGAVLLGATGQDTVTLEESAQYVRFSDITFSGGRDQIRSEELSTYVTLDRVAFQSPERAGIHLDGHAEEWYLNAIRANGGQYFWWHEYTGAVKLFDKTTFVNVATHGQTENCYRIEVDASNGVTWINPMFIHCEKEAMLVEGGIRSWALINPTTEGIGYNGDNAFTTGTISSGTDSLVVASATGFAEGDTITVAGAGASGVDLTTAITTIAGTTFTLADNAGTSVTDAWTTNALYAEFSFGNAHGSAANVLWFGGIIGARKAESGVRYAVDASVASNFYFYGTGGDTGAAEIPVYDPQNVARRYGGHIVLRKPSSLRYAVTNVTTDRTYNANSTTTDELADVLGTVIAALQTEGILG